MTFLRRILILVLPCAIAALLYWDAYHTDRIAGRTTSTTGKETITLVSRTHTIDRIYHSMQGPFSNHSGILLAEGAARQLLWVTGIRCELVDKDGRSPISREFFCHSNLTFTPGCMTQDRTGEKFTSSQDWRLFTLVPGRLEISLPEGFGFPVYSDEQVDYYSMSLNLNEKSASRQVRFKTQIDFVRDGAPAAPTKPLFRRAIYGYEPIGTAQPGTICHSAVHPGAACGPFVGKAASNSFVASLGKTNTIHWLIPPGTYESRVPVDVQLDLPYDTTVHFVTGHLHPFGKSVALYDATLGRTVFEIRSRDFDNRLGVAEMDQISSIEGVSLYNNHHYELVTRYLNPTSEPIDAMSILYLYAFDKTFDGGNPRSQKRLTTSGSASEGSGAS